MSTQETSTHHMIHNMMRTPDLSDEQFVGAVCGLRPCRRGGLRIETERLGSKTIVHHYGHGGCGVTLSFGSAQLAADLVDGVAKPNQSIAVLGAGIVGLTTARELLNRGYKVRLYADKVAVQTTSAIAAALWLPVGIDHGDTPGQVELINDALVRSKRVFDGLDPETYGIQDLDMYEPMSSSTDEFVFENGTIEPPRAIEAFPFATNAVPGRVFTSKFIHNNQFLRVIHDEVLALGGEIVERKIESSNELGELDETVLVNCLALGSKQVFGDERVYPARGVIVHVKAQDLGYGVHDGYRYLFPRKDALILGGCFQEERWDEVPDQVMIDEILDHHRRFFA